ncbi:MAG: serine protease, partial [Candidatus Electrothrix sp. EH2]|nr:serine protease [Candidatus Electrothrix sp. EH2]
NEKEKLSSYQERLTEMGASGAEDELKLLIIKRKKYLADFRYHHEKDERRFAEQKKVLKHPAVKIVLSDGSEQSVSLMQVSRNYDLALLKSGAVQRKVVCTLPPPGTFLRTGDSVFILLGSSAASEYQRMMTASCAGYRRIGLQNRLFLQIDTAIPPHKSGGPILDATGYVRAVAVGALRKGDDLVFAVPIEKVLHDFAAFLE